LALTDRWSITLTSAYLVLTLNMVATAGPLSRLSPTVGQRSFLAPSVSVAFSEMSVCIIQRLLSRER